MAYYGYIEVVVNLMRQGHGVDSSGELGSGFGLHATRTIRIEEYHARYIGRSCAPEDADKATEADEQMDKVEAAIREVLDEDAKDDMRERWDAATRNMSREQMEAALEVLEESREREINPPLLAEWRHGDPLPLALVDSVKSPVDLSTVESVRFVNNRAGFSKYGVVDNDRDAVIPPSDLPVGLYEIKVTFKTGRVDLNAGKVFVRSL